MSDDKKWEMDSPYGEIKDDKGHKATKKHSKRSMGIGAFTLVLILILVLMTSTLIDIGSLIPTSNNSNMDMVDRPSLETIYTASPLYTPEINYTSEIGRDHVNNMNNKVDDLLDVTDEMMDSYMGMKDEVIDTLNIVVPLLQDMDRAYGTDYATNSEVLKELDQLMVEYELEEFKYYGLDIKRVDEALYDSDVAFSRVVAAMTATEKVTDAYQLLTNFSSTIFAQLEGNDDKEIQGRLSDLEKSYQKSKANEYGATLMAGVDTVVEMVKQIDTANAFLALENLAIMGESLDEVKSNVEALKNSNLVDDEFVELSELMTQEYEQMYIGLNGELENYINELEIDITRKPKKSFFDLIKPRVVLAVSSDNRYRYGAGYDVQMLQKKGMEIMRQQRKEYQEKYKNESYWDTTVRTAKELRKGTQDAVENLDTAVYEGSRMTAAIFTPTQGDGIKDAYDDIKVRHDLAKRRKEEGKGGVEVFKTAVDGFQATQDMAADGWYNIGAFCENELGLPEDSVSQVGSIMGNIAAESFTQFGQGLSRILDPNAKDSDIAKGCIEVATSMVGGSQNVFSATKASGAALKKMSEIMVSPKLHAQGVIDAVKAVKDFSLSKLGSVKYTEKAVKGTLAILKKSKNVAKNMVGKLDDAFTKDIAGIFTNNWKQSLAGFREYANKVGSNVDDSAVKLIDEFINGYIDNKVTELASHPWLWDENVSNEEKEKLLAGEVEKMNEDIQQGLETIQGQLEENVLNGMYKGTWTLLDIQWLADEEELWERPGVGPGNLLKAYRESIGNSYPCSIDVNGNIVTIKMSPQSEDFRIIYNSDNFDDIMVKDVEVIINQGDIIGFEIETNHDVYITSVKEKEKTIIEGQYYFTHKPGDPTHFKERTFSTENEAIYGITFGFTVESNN